MIKRLSCHISLILVFILILTSKLSGQESSKHNIGFEWSYGSQMLYVDVDYSYRVHLFKIPYHYNLNQSGKWHIDILVKPQFNLVNKISDSTEGTDGIEFGVNAGFQFKYLVGPKGSNLYCFITAGPHHISNAPSRQIDGFIFSDNFGLGYNMNTDRGFSVYAHIGIRHLSNASFRSPNGGINTAMIAIGILKKI